MDSIDAMARHVERLRQWRNRRERDYSLGFLQQHFKHTVERPHRQLQGFIELWPELVPEPLISHTRLESFSRGVLHVAVDSAPWRYELDRLLRGGLQRELITRFKGGSLRRVAVRVARVEEPPR